MFIFPRSVVAPLVAMTVAALIVVVDTVFTVATP